MWIFVPSSGKAGLGFLVRIKCIKKREKWDRLGKTRTERGVSETDWFVYTCCQNSTRLCIVRPGATSVDPGTVRWGGVS